MLHLRRCSCFRSSLGPVLTIDLVGVAIRRALVGGSQGFLDQVDDEEHRTIEEIDCQADRKDNGHHG